MPAAARWLATSYAFARSCLPLLETGQFLGMFGNNRTCDSQGCYRCVRAVKVHTQRASQPWQLIVKATRTRVCMYDFGPECCANQHYGLSRRHSCLFKDRGCALSCTCQERKRCTRSTVDSDLHQNLCKRRFLCPNALKAAHIHTCWL